MISGNEIQSGSDGHCSYIELWAIQTKKGHREAPNIKGCLLLIIGIKCEIKGVARQPLWEECNCNLEASEFFAETHLDKSRLRK